MNLSRRTSVLWIGEIHEARLFPHLRSLSITRGYPMYDEAHISYI